ncbi:hypothetical protein CK203_092759 [Vitis vinifera]|uniref:DC1 domain-containing protein n=1 Tax=Vitis vinifera TaxID=29760 RepID=A0A438EPC0_VITVI|nr:hypothetical protein CK203_092759 [Vitis vinifera]
MATSMKLHKEEIDIASHPRHRSLKLKPAEKSCYCGGCKEMVFFSQECYQCEHEDGHQKCDFHLHDPRGRHMVCDACGNDVKGWFFQSSTPGESRYLHPCCAKLDFKRTIRNGSIELDLKEETSSVCLICRNEGQRRERAKDEASNQQPSYETGTTSGVLVTGAQKQDVRQRRGETGLDLLEFAVDLVIFVISVIFGIPFPSVSKWIRKIW